MTAAVFSPSPILVFCQRKGEEGPLDPFAVQPLIELELRGKVRVARDERRPTIPNFNPRRAGGLNFPPSAGGGGAFSRPPV